MIAPLEFEKGVGELEARLAELRRRRTTGDKDAESEIARLEGRLQRLLQQVYRRLGPLQRLQVARHPDRPGAGTCITALVEGYRPLLTEPSTIDGVVVLGGVGRYRGYTVVALGVEMAGSKPDDDRTVPPDDASGRERRMRRLLALAGSFDLPLLVFVAMTGEDHANGARTGTSARFDHTVAAAAVMEVSFRLTAPMIAVVTGAMTGAGAGGLLAGDRVLMLEHAVITPLAPEAAAAALWEDEGQTRAAAEALKLTAPDMAALGVVDEVILEPPGGAHRHPDATIGAIGDAIGKELRTLMDVPGPRRLAQRHERLLAMGTREPE
ncbi:MAG: acetyl-CoA carboxylase carboxyl transferase subunit alpha [Rhodospirillales bacterium]|nr:acetyl-CoA carboxylase carboxyl transferase subunit alpha [Rhodospirillales bacterium]